MQSTITRRVSHFQTYKVSILCTKFALSDTQSETERHHNAKISKCKANIKSCCTQSSLHIPDTAFRIIPISIVDSRAQPPGSTNEVLCILLTGGCCHGRQQVEMTRYVGIVSHDLHLAVILEVVCVAPLSRLLRGLYV